MTTSSVTAAGLPKADLYRTRGEGGGAVFATLSFVEDKVYEDIILCPTELSLSSLLMFWKMVLQAPPGGP